MPISTTENTIPVSVTSNRTRSLARFRHAISAVMPMRCMRSNSMTRPGFASIRVRLGFGPPAQQCGRDADIARTQWVALAATSRCLIATRGSR